MIDHYMDPIDVADIQAWFQVPRRVRVADSKPHAMMPFSSCLYGIFWHLKEELVKVSMTEDWYKVDQYLCPMSEANVAGNEWRRHLVQNCLSACGISNGGAGFDLNYVPHEDIDWIKSRRQPVWLGDPGTPIEGLGRANVMNANILRLAWVEEICRRLEAAGYPKE